MKKIYFLLSNLSFKSNKIYNQTFFITSNNQLFYLELEKNFLKITPKINIKIR